MNEPMCFISSVLSFSGYKTPRIKEALTTRTSAKPDTSAINVTRSYTERYLKIFESDRWNRARNIMPGLP
jgi:hypothetical protein